MFHESGVINSLNFFKRSQPNRRSNQIKAAPTTKAQQIRTEKGGDGERETSTKHLVFFVIKQPKKMLRGKEDSSA